VSIVAVMREVGIKDDPEEDIDKERDEDMEEREVDPPLVLTVER